MSRMDSTLASAAWLYMGGAGRVPRCLAQRTDVPALWCLLLAQAAVVPAIAVAEEGTQTPQLGLRVNAQTALANWQQFCAYIDRHPQFHRVPALGIYLAAVAEFLQQCAAELGEPLADLWLQGDLDAVSGPFDYVEQTRIEFWQWRVDSSLEIVQDGADVDLHEITQVLDFEDLDEWVRSFGLEHLDHPYFRALAQLDDFEEQGTRFEEFREHKPQPLDPWLGHGYRAISHANKVGMRAQDATDEFWHVPPQWDEIRRDAESYTRVWVRQAQQWGLLQIEPALELLFAPQFDEVVDSAAGGRCVVLQGGRYGVIDIEQRGWRLPAEYGELRQECNGLLRLRQGERYGYLDEFGSVLVPPRYEQTHAFGGPGRCDAPGLAWVAEGGLWGLIDASGQVLQPCCFSRIEYRQEQENRGWRVWQQDRQGWVDAAGALVVACEWDEVDCFTRHVHAIEAEGIYRVTRDGRQGLLPREGDWHVACRYMDIEPLGVGPGAPPLPTDPWRLSPSPEEADVASYIASGSREQSRLLIRVTDERGTGVIDEAGRQIVPMAEQAIETLGNRNLQWLAVCDEEDRYHLWDVLKREPALPGRYAAVDVLPLAAQALLLTFDELQDERPYVVQCWWAADRPAIAGRFSDLGDGEFFLRGLMDSQRKALVEAWDKGETVDACELLDDGSSRRVFIRPGAAPIDAIGEWQRRYGQGDLDAALALARTCRDTAQAYAWAQRACGAERPDATPSSAAWIYLIELVLQGAGGAAVLGKTRQWLERAMLVDSNFDEGYQLLLLQGRLWLDPATGTPDAHKAFAALERLRQLSGRNQREHSEGLYLLGRCWRDGLGCAVDQAKARDLWRAVASDGHGPATQALVELLVDEAEQHTDADAAGQLWQEALHHAQNYLEHFADDGVPALIGYFQHFLGETLLRTEPVEWEAAADHLHQAAATGHAEAMGLLAEVVYRDPVSPLRNLRQALNWAWRYAAAQGLIASATSGWKRWLFALFWLRRRG